MTIKVGDRLPESRFRVMKQDGTMDWKPSSEVFKGKTVALFAVPGAFTGTCHKLHLPTVQQNVAALKAKGVDTVAITAVNDVFVMEAWKNATKSEGIEFLADGNAEFAKAVGLDNDATGGGMGIRSKRYSMLVKDGVVQKLNVEKPGPGVFEVSGGDVLLSQL